MSTLNTSLDILRSADKLYEGVDVTRVPQKDKEFFSAKTQTSNKPVPHLPWFCVNTKSFLGGIVVDVETETVDEVVARLVEDVVSVIEVDAGNVEVLDWRGHMFGSETVEPSQQTNCRLSCEPPRHPLKNKTTTKAKTQARILTKYRIK